MKPLLNMRKKSLDGAGGVALNMDGMFHRRTICLMTIRGAVDIGVIIIGTGIPIKFEIIQVRALSPQLYSVESLLLHLADAEADNVEVVHSEHSTSQRTPGRILKFKCEALRLPNADSLSC